jgi:hypothetical protein
MRKDFDWNRSRISMLEVEAVVQIGFSIALYIYIYIYIYIRSVLLMESFDLRPRNHILVRVIPSCFRFAKKGLCQVSLLSRRSPRYTISTWCRLRIWRIPVRGRNNFWWAMPLLCLGGSNFILHCCIYSTLNISVIWGRFQFYQKKTSKKGSLVLYGLIFQTFVTLCSSFSV